MGRKSHKVRTTRTGHKQSRLWRFLFWGVAGLTAFAAGIVFLPRQTGNTVTANVESVPPIFAPGAEPAKPQTPTPAPAPTPTQSAPTNQPQPSAPSITNVTGTSQPASRPQPLVTNVPPLQPVLRPKPTPPPPPNVFPRGVQSILEAQIALARQGISSGSIDGLIGNQTRAALAAFQTEQGLSPTGELDDYTKELLVLTHPPLTNYYVTDADLARLQPVSPTWLGKSQQTALDYETLIELVAEKFQAHPNCLRKLNASVNWTNCQSGDVLKVPDASMPVVRADASFIRIFLTKRLLQVFDASTNLVAHFPCSIAQRVEKRPEGELRVIAVAPDPNYTFDPAVFPESEEARQLNRKLILPPGPNNPVGVAWISLDKPGYGIHGTPQPEQVGRTESHGCFRLANWNAQHLLKLVRIGMPVHVEN